MSRYRLLYLLPLALALFACDNKEIDIKYQVKRPTFKIDEEKYGDLINHNAESPGDLIRKRAFDTYELEYFIAMEHKAIAQSSSGAWGWSKDHDSPDEAMDRALELCRKTNHEPEKPCMIVNIDAFWAADFYREKKLRP